LARLYGDDLRRKFLYPYDQGEGTLEDLVGRFSVSLGWAKSISVQRNHTGQAERKPYHPGRKPVVGVHLHPLVKGWFAVQHDLTLAEVQEKLKHEASTCLSLPQIWQLLRKLDLYLKKSLHAAERDTEANRKQRQEFVARVATVPAERLFSWTKAV
jgi:transposase